MGIKEALKESGWRVPTPHEVLGLVVTVVTAMEMIDFYSPGSKGAKVCMLVVAVAALLGIGSASKRLPGRVKERLEKLEDIEAKAIAAGGGK